MNGYIKTIVKQKAKIQKEQTKLSSLLTGLDNVRQAIVADIESVDAQKDAKLAQAKVLYEQKIAQAKELLTATVNGVTENHKAQKTELTSILTEHFSSD